MAKFRMSLEDQLRGVQKALKNPKTPKQFKAELQRQVAQLKIKLKK